MADVASIANESFSQAMQSFQEVVQTAAKLQEESVKGLQEMLGGLATPTSQKWTKVQAITNDLVALAQKNTEDTLQAMEQNLRTGMELWQKALETPRDNPAANVQDRTMAPWQTMLGILHTNTETILRANRRNRGSLDGAGHDSNGQVAEARGLPRARSRRRRVGWAERGEAHQNACANSGGPRSALPALLPAHGTCGSMRFTEEPGNAFSSLLTWASVYGPPWTYNLWIWGNALKRCNSASVTWLLLVQVPELHRPRRCCCPASGSIRVPLRDELRVATAP